MSPIIPILITAIAALWATVEYNRRPYWSLMPGYAIVIAGLVSATSWLVWLLMTLFT